MKSITVKAPGKLMIMGEHAVVYGYPCMVTAIDKYLTVKAEIGSGKTDRFTTPGVSNQTFICAAVSAFKKNFGISQKIRLETASELGVYGFGSSAATVVAAVYALAVLFKKELTQNDLFQFCYRIVLDVQKQASGFDVAASIYGGTVYFNGKTKEIIPISDSVLPIIVAYSGVKANTVKMIQQVSRRRANFRRGVDAVFQGIEKLVLEGKTAIEEKNWQRLGTLLNFNQNYLEDLGVSNEKINTMIGISLKTGAYGAKISGAGGGDCIIVLTSEQKKNGIIRNLKSAGGEIIPVATGVCGVRKVCSEP
jgi:mevalonate kinase